MNEPIEEIYFDWLCSKVISPYSKNHYELMQILFQTEFIWVVPGDRNRAEDGVELREDFLRQAFIKKDAEWFNESCSIFEALLSFAKRLSFQTDDPVREWFWIFMKNLELDEYRQVSKEDILVIEEILYNFVWRIYSPNGYGGLFPLDNPKEDQRKVEIWYEFCAWADEKDLI